VFARQRLVINALCVGTHGNHNLLVARAFAASHRWPLPSQRARGKAQSASERGGCIREVCVCRGNNRSVEVKRVALLVCGVCVVCVAITAHLNRWLKLILLDRTHDDRDRRASQRAHDASLSSMGGVLVARWRSRSKAATHNSRHVTAKPTL
jgi:hypothetical protein